jgi:hypothetical protein
MLQLEGMPFVVASSSVSASSWPATCFHPAAPYRPTTYHAERACWYSLSQDRCLTTFMQVHLIIKSHNPKTGKLHERHLEDPPAPKGDKLTHIYTLELSPDNRWGQSPAGSVTAAVYCSTGVLHYGDTLSMPGTHEHY